MLLADYDVLKAGSGHEGMVLLDGCQGKVDLIIVDQRMPEITGDEFLKQVKERYGDIAAIMLSGYAELGDLMPAFHAGDIYRFIAKPWDNDELLTVIKSAMRLTHGGV